MIVQNHYENFVFLFIIQIDSHDLILNKFWINRHDFQLNMIKNRCWFEFEHCDYKNKIFLSKKFNIFQKLYNFELSINKIIYLFRFFEIFEILSSIKFSKYQILQKHNDESFYELLFITSTKDFSIILNAKNHSFKTKRFKSKRKLTVEVRFQSSSTIKFFFSNFERFKKHAKIKQRFSAFSILSKIVHFFSSIFSAKKVQNENDETFNNAFDFDVFFF